MTTLVNALEPRGGRYGLQTTCEGGGKANATLVERLGRPSRRLRVNLGV
jgi:acetyl-CoA acyltransferase